MSKEKINSVHLQDFPNVSNIKDNKNLIVEMDKVRDICSVALSIRDKKNLRVRLPLQSVKIVGNGVDKLEKYSDIIADEVNVKNIEFSEEIGKLAEFKIQIDFKKIGARIGQKIPALMKAAKAGEWKQINDGSLEIANEVLSADEYEVKLQPYNTDSTDTIKTNDAIVILDTNITPELELEGIARDLVRMIQQNRREADLNVSDRINIAIKTGSKKIKDAIQKHSGYIKEQTLCVALDIEEQFKTTFSFDGELDEEDVAIGFNLN